MNADLGIEIPEGLFGKSKGPSKELAMELYRKMVIHIKQTTNDAKLQREKQEMQERDDKTQ